MILIAHDDASPSLMKRATKSSLFIERITFLVLDRTQIAQQIQVPEQILSLSENSNIQMEYQMKMIKHSREGVL